MSVISARHLRKEYGKVVAVDDLGFDVPAGTVTGFLGPNGAGKTTTLRMLLGLTAPTSGTAQINGRSYATLQEPARTVGALLETTGYHPGRRAADHLLIACEAAGLHRGRVQTVLEEVELADAADRRVGGFSLGMRRRLGLATALLGDPDVLILDEPQNGLDPDGVRWLRRLLRARADEGRTILVSSHLLAEVARTVDHVIVLRKGRLVAQGRLEELAGQPVVRVRADDTGALRAALERHTLRVEADGDCLLVRGAGAEDVRKAAAAVRTFVHEISVQAPDLEQVFLSLTREGL